MCIKSAREENSRKSSQTAPGLPPAKLVKEEGTRSGEFAWTVNIDRMDGGQRTQKYVTYCDKGRVRAAAAKRVCKISKTTREKARCGCLNKGQKILYAQAGTCQTGIIRSAMRGRGGSVSCRKGRLQSG